MENRSYDSTNKDGENIYCIHCNAFLQKDVASCASCDWPFDINDDSTYRIKTSKSDVAFHGLLLSIFCGVVTYAIIMLNQTRLGPALFFVVPISAGVVLGYMVRVHLLFTIFLSLTAISSIVVSLVTFSLSGIFCGLTLGAIFFVPFMGGAALGRFLKKVVSDRLVKKVYFLLFLIITMPFYIAFVENRILEQNDIVTVRTQSEIGAGADMIWDKILFYEELNSSRALLLKLGLPRPLGVEGRRSAVGDTAKCQYDKGYIVKRIKAVEKFKLLSFDVIEQSVHFEHDVKLIDGDFQLETIDSTKSRLILRTRYISKLHPAWLWNAMEKAVIRALHQHVIEGITQNIAREKQKRKEFYE